VCAFSNNTRSQAWAGPQLEALAGVGNCLSGYARALCAVRCASRQYCQTALGTDLVSEHWCEQVPLAEASSVVLQTSTSMGQLVGLTCNTVDVAGFPSKLLTRGGVHLVQLLS
jgi:hypothetical protein